MAGPGGDVGMDRGDLKRMLRLARRETVHAAFALGGDGKPIIMLDKRKQPRALEKGIKDSAPDARNTRFGSVLIDPDDPKLARFVINKAASGMARKLIIALKGTGFNKVQIVLEDGSAIESAEGEAEPDDDAEDGDGPDWDRELATPDGEDAPAPQREAATDVPEDVVSPDQQATQPDTTSSDDAPAPAAAPDAPATPDVATLTKTLTALVKRMLAVIAKDPSQKAALPELATDAQASLKRGDLSQAEAAIAVLGQALDGVDSTAADASGSAAADDASAPAPDQSAAPPDQTATPAPAATTASTDQPAASAAPGNGAAATYTKSRMVWMATRQKMDGDIGKLHDAFMTVFKDHSQADALNKAFGDRISAVMEQFDEALAHKLDEIAANTDPAQHAKLVQEAQVQVQRYQSYLASEPLIATLDSNPFTPLAIEKTMTATLSALSKALR